MRRKRLKTASSVERFHSALQTATDREQMVKKSLDERTAEGMKLNEAATQYAVMRQEANSSHDLLHAREGEDGRSRFGRRRPELEYLGGGLCAAARKAGGPDLLLYMAITFFAGLWLAVGGALLMESLHPSTGPGEVGSGDDCACWLCFSPVHSRACAGAHAPLSTAAHRRRPHSVYAGHKRPCPIPRTRPRSGTACRDQVSPEKRVAAHRRHSHARAHRPWRFSRCLRVPHAGVSFMVASLRREQSRCPWSTKCRSAAWTSRPPRAPLKRAARRGHAAASPGLGAGDFTQARM
jgi:hypothetical protein